MNNSAKNQILKVTLSLLIVLLSVGFGWAQTEDADKYVVYKKTVQRDLGISMYLPKINNNQPLVIFFHGGGWIKGSPKQFLPYAQYLSKRGIVCALVEYRLKDADNTDPFTALEDAKSAVRFLKKNAGNYNIDTTKIILSGGSAGGHLAAACQWVKGFDDSGDDLTINTKGRALVLFNPVVDTGPNGYGYERIKDSYKDFSPFHQLKKDSIDVLVMCGTKDKLIPVATMEVFEKDINNNGGNCKVVLYEGAEHGFFNKPPYQQQTQEEMILFLKKLNFLSNKPFSQ